jgi:hypothetical protein
MQLWKQLNAIGHGKGIRLLHEVCILRADELPHRACASVMVMMGAMAKCLVFAMARKQE